MKSGKTVLLLSLWMLGYVVSFAQLSENQIKKIDALFTEWNSTQTPGCVIGIIRNDSLLFSKGYGMANLETATPNTSETVYMLASVSKQFTAYCIVLLVRQGKVKLDEDIRTYIPWFPDMGAKITVRNLLNNTSGIRDELLLHQIAGTRWDDVVIQEDDIRLLKKQTALNFRPNEKYAYSNSNYILLAEIVRVVSRQTFRAFADSALFKPLQMSNSFFYDNHLELIKNRANGYGQEEAGSPYLNMIFNRSTVGSSNLYSTVGDMCKWMRNFYDIKVGDASAIDLLTASKAKPDNGEKSNYAFGILSYKYKGLELYEHEGRQNGYVAQVLIFPRKKMGVVVLGNLRDLPCRKKAFELADLFIEKRKETVEKEEIVDSSKAILEDLSFYMKYTGNYINEQGIRYKILIYNNKLYLQDDDENYLLQVEKETAIPLTEPEHTFVFEIKEGDTLLHQKWASGKRTLKKRASEKGFTTDELKKYEGTYYNSELDCKYNIVLRNHELWMTHKKYDDSKLDMVGSEDLFSSAYWWMEHLTILRDSQKQIEGFEVNIDRIHHLKFLKID